MRMMARMCSIAAVALLASSVALAAPPADKTEKAKKDKGAQKDAAQKDAAKKDTAKKAEKKAEPKKDAKKQPSKKEMEKLKKVAGAAFAEGKAKFEEKDYNAALTSFKKANETLPNPAVYVKIADCLEKLENVPEAIAWLEKYVAEKADAPNLPDIKARIDALGKTPGKLILASAPEGAKIFVDDADTGKAAPSDVEVAPGKHVVKLALAGYADGVQEVELQPGAKQEVKVELVAAPEAPKEAISEDYPEEPPAAEQAPEEKPAEPAPAKPAPVHKGVWASAGIAGAGIVAATVLGIMALNKEADFEDAVNQGKKADETDAQYNDRLKEMKDKGKGLAIGCDVAWGIGAAATVAGIITYYVTQPKKAKETKVSNVTVAPLVGKSTTGAAVGFSF